MVYGSRRYWKYIARPIFLSLALFVGLVVLGWWLLIPRLQLLASSWWGWQPGVSGTLGTVLFAVAVFLSASMIFLTLTSLFSAFMWEKLSYEIEEDLFGSAETYRYKQHQMLFDSGMRMAHAFPFLCCAGLSGLIFWPLAILPAGWLGLHDFTSSALMRRGIMFHRQTQRTLKLDGWPGFMALSGLIGVFPFVNIFLLPALVAGGTIMVAESEGRTRVKLLDPKMN